MCPLSSVSVNYSVLRLLQKRLARQDLRQNCNCLWSFLDKNWEGCVLSDNSYLCGHSDRRILPLWRAIYREILMTEGSYYVTWTINLPPVLREGIIKRRHHCFKRKIERSESARWTCSSGSLVLDAVQRDNWSILNSWTSWIHVVKHFGPRTHGACQSQYE